MASVADESKFAAQLLNSAVLTLNQRAQVREVFQRNDRVDISGLSGNISRRLRSAAARNAGTMTDVEKEIAARVFG